MLFHDIYCKDTKKSEMRIFNTFLTKIIWQNQKNVVTLQKIAIKRAKINKFIFRA